MNPVPLMHWWGVSSQHKSLHDRTPWYSGTYFNRKKVCVCWRFESWLGLCRIDLSCPFCVAGVAWSIFTRFFKLNKLKSFSRREIDENHVDKRILGGKGFAVGRLNKHNLCPASVLAPKLIRGRVRFLFPLRPRWFVGKKSAQMMLKEMALLSVFSSLFDDFQDLSLRRIHCYLAGVAFLSICEHIGLWSVGFLTSYSTFPWQGVAGQS